MNSWLSLFSDWTLALLPRLFLYPGGLWALFMLLALRAVQSPKSKVQSHSPRPDFGLPEGLPLAVGWVALSLLTLPGTAPLPFPADRFALAGLLLTSLALDRHSGGVGGGKQPAGRVSVNMALLLAIMAPLAGGRSLLQGEAGWGVSGWLALTAVAVGLVGLSAGGERDPAAGVRWLAWLGLGAAPLWAAWGLTLPLPGPAWLWVSVAYLAAILALAGVGRAGYVRQRPWLPAATCWGLGALSALVSLLR